MIFFGNLGSLYLVSCGATITRFPVHSQADTVINPPSSSSQGISVNGSQISVASRLQSLCDLASLEQFKRLHLNKSSTNEKFLSSTSPPTPK